MMWKEAARHFWHGRKLAREQELRLKRRIWVEHEKRMALIAAMSDLLPRMALYGRFCRTCDSVWAEGHREGCRYLRALAAVNEAARSID